MVQADDDLSFWRMLRTPQYARVLSSTIPVLGLGIMGSALFPLPEAFISTGVIANISVMIVVAAGTLYTSELLLHQAYKTGQSDLETLCLAVGGRRWKLFTEVSVILLLVGSVVGAVVQTGEIFGKAASFFAGDKEVPAWVDARSGSVFMIIVCIAVFPLCMVELMTQLEYASYVGFIFVLLLLGTVMVQSIAAGLPALATCTAAELPLALCTGARQVDCTLCGGLAKVGFSSIGAVSASVSTIAFAFYIQPIAMPMLREMPGGKVGVNLLKYSVRFTIIGTAFCAYFIIGFFGAARWGQSTSGNILENEWGEKYYNGVLNVLLAVYLVLSLPPLVYPVAHILQDWIPTKGLPIGVFRRFVIVSIVVGASLGISLAVPGESSYITVITGCTGVFLTCYLIPIVNHLWLYTGRARCQQKDALTPEFWRKEGVKEIEMSPDMPTDRVPSAFLDDGNMVKHSIAGIERTSMSPISTDATSYREIPKSEPYTAYEWGVQIFLPIVVLLLGVLFSGMAFWSFFAG